MGQKMVDCDRFLLRIESEFRKNLDDWRIQSEIPGFNELEHGSTGGNRFCQTGDIEDRIDLYFPGCFFGGLSSTCNPPGLSMEIDRGNGTGVISLPAAFAEKFPEIITHWLEGREYAGQPV